jgi:CubicO group peptidase (beta-lactamase class C family)
VDEFVKKFCSGDLEFEPGTKFHYDNSGYFLLGAILEHVTGTS